ncbi:MAG: hypothetical protein AB8B85_23110 [Paracoccaceae bacterium]
MSKLCRALLDAIADDALVDAVLEDAEDCRMACRSRKHGPAERGGGRG